MHTYKQVIVKIFNNLSEWMPAMNEHGYRCCWSAFYSIWFFCLSCNLGSIVSQVCSLDRVYGDIPSASLHICSYLYLTHRCYFSSLLHCHWKAWCWSGSSSSSPPPLPPPPSSFSSLIFLLPVSCKGKKNNHYTLEKLEFRVVVF